MGLPHSSARVLVYSFARPRSSGYTTWLVDDVSRAQLSIRLAMAYRPQFSEGLLYRTQYSLRSGEVSRSITVDSGISLLRYTGGATRDASPSVHVWPGEYHGSDISVIPAPGLQDTVLRAPGDYVVVKAERAGKLDLHIRARRPGGSVGAQFELNRVALPLTPGFAPSGLGPQILAHIAHRGDILFDAGDWICGPENPARIEGLEIRWPARPDGLLLFYSVTSDGHEQHMPREYGLDEYAGTRGRSRPLSGVRFRLANLDGENMELRIEALFQGYGVRSATGRDVSLTGPTGREPLLGLRLAVEPASQVPHTPRQNPALKIVRPRSRVQMFRGTGPAPESSSRPERPQ
jgi:hypothetical protein